VLFGLHRPRTEGGSARRSRSGTRYTEPRWSWRQTRARCGRSPARCRRPRSRRVAPEPSLDTAGSSHEAGRPDGTQAQVEARRLELFVVDRRGGRDPARVRRRADATGSRPPRRSTTNQFQPASPRPAPGSRRLPASCELSLPYRETVQARPDATEAGDSRAGDRPHLARVWRHAPAWLGCTSCRFSSASRSALGARPVQSEEHDRSSRRVHARHHRRHAALRRGGCRLPRRTLSGGVTAVLSRASAGRPLVESAPARERAPRCSPTPSWSSCIAPGRCLYDDDDRPVPIERRERSTRASAWQSTRRERKTAASSDFRAHPNPPAVDLSRVDHYDAGEFWEPIKRPGAIHTSSRPTGSTSWCPRSASAFLPASRPRWSCTTPAPGRSERTMQDFFDPGFGYGDGGCSDEGRDGGARPRSAVPRV